MHNMLRLTCEPSPVSLWASSVLSEFPNATFYSLIYIWRQRVWISIRWCHVWGTATPKTVWWSAVTSSWVCDIPAVLWDTQQSHRYWDDTRTAAVSDSKNYYQSEVLLQDLTPGAPVTSRYMNVPQMLGQKDEGMFALSQQFQYMQPVGGDAISTSEEEFEQTEHYSRMPGVTEFQQLTSSSAAINASSFGYLTVH